MVSIQSCSHFGALNLSYTLPHLSCQVFIFIWVKWNIQGEVPCPRTQHWNNVQCLRRGEHDISLKILNQAGLESAREAVTSAERHALTIAPCPSLKTWYGPVFTEALVWWLSTAACHAGAQGGFVLLFEIQTSKKQIVCFIWSPKLHRGNEMNGVLSPPDTGFEIWVLRSEAEQATSRWRRLSTILNLKKCAVKKHFVSFKFEDQTRVRTRDLRLSKQPALAPAQIA